MRSALEAGFLRAAWLAKRLPHIVWGRHLLLTRKATPENESDLCRLEVRTLPTVLCALHEGR